VGSRAEPASSTRGKFTLELHLRRQLAATRPRLPRFLLPPLPAISRAPVSAV
jgi:hypothetical protein